MIDINELEKAARAAIACAHTEAQVASGILLAVIEKLEVKEESNG